MKLKVLGGLKLEGADFTRPVPLVILSYLILEEGKQSRSKLANLFWPYEIRIPKNLSPLALRLYLHLWEAWKTQSGGVCKKDYADLCEDIGLIANDELANIKQQLDPVHRELKSLNFLKEFSYELSEDVWCLKYVAGEQYLELWEKTKGRTGSQKKNNLRDALSKLKSVIGESLEVDNKEVATSMNSDLKEFRKAFREGNLAKASKLYSGHFLKDIEEELNGTTFYIDRDLSNWISNARESLAREAYKVKFDLAKREVCLGKIEEGTNVAEQAWRICKEFGLEDEKLIDLHKILVDNNSPLAKEVEEKLEKENFESKKIVENNKQEKPSRKKRVTYQSERPKLSPRLLSWVLLAITVLWILGWSVSQLTQPPPQNSLTLPPSPETLIPPDPHKISNLNLKADQNQPSSEENQDSPGVRDKKNKEALHNSHSNFEQLQIAVTSNIDWTPVKQDFDGTTMVLVPAGSFSMGSEEGYPNERPVHTQHFDSSFWIDETEVRRSDYERCVSAEYCAPTHDDSSSNTADQPINKISWHGAATYCQWRKARLPTEAEWEYAARGPNNFVYPWGNEFDGEKLNYRQNSGNQTVNVEANPSGASWVGALNMSGNLTEWTSSLYRDYPYISSDGRELTGNEIYVAEDVSVRGGSFREFHREIRTYARYAYDAKRDGSDSGFRCANSDPPSISSDKSNTSATLIPFPEKCIGIAKNYGGLIATSNADWTPVKCDFNDTVMLLVPAGEFTMGSERNEKPNLQSFSKSFWIDETEVTRDKYKTCLSAGKCTPTESNRYSTANNQPINYVDWYQANTYCKSRGARLPTESEWEYAARGPDSLQYPWGNEFDKNKVHYYLNADKKTAPVGNYPNGASWVGALDMLGNLAEWTSSLHYPYPYVNGDGRELTGMEDNINYSISFRGGSFLNIADDLRTASRSDASPVFDGYISGFRCVRSNPNF